jgi:hypothetical protein
MMLEELQRRNYAKTTIDCYLRSVEDFSRHFHCSPDRLARKIHDFRNTKGLAMVQIRYLGGFATKNEAFACQNIPQQTVFFFEISLIDRWSRSLINSRAVPMAGRFY